MPRCCSKSSCSASNNVGRGPGLRSRKPPASPSGSNRELPALRRVRRLQPAGRALRPSARRQAGAPGAMVSRRHARADGPVAHRRALPPQGGIRVRAEQRQRQPRDGALPGRVHAHRPGGGVPRPQRPRERVGLRAARPPGAWARAAGHPAPRARPDDGRWAAGGGDAGGDREPQGVARAGPRPARLARAPRWLLHQHPQSPGPFHGGPRDDQESTVAPRCARICSARAS